MSKKVFYNNIYIHLIRYKVCLLGFVKNYKIKNFHITLFLKTIWMFSIQLLMDLLYLHILFILIG